MDKHYYYRLLGLTCDATPSQVKSAYEARMAKLDLPDYADDPEYRRKKRAQATMAYRVLMGNAPAPSKKQKEAGFERFKDVLERKEDFDDCDVCVDEDDKSSFKKRFQKALNQSNSRRKTTVNLSPMAGRLVALLIVALTILIIVVTIFAIATDVDGDQEYNYIENIHEEVYELDYWWNLDASTCSTYASQVDWSEGYGLYGESDTYDATVDLLYTLDIDNFNEFYYHITGIENYYYDYDDLDCANALITWMGAPHFKEVAGATNWYTDEIILNHGDYLRYLEELVWYEM